MESGVALGGSLSFYIPEQADALMRLLTRARPSMVWISALRPRAKVSQMEVLGLGSLPHQLCRSCLRGYPPWSCDPAPSPLERVRGSRTVTWDVQGGRWLSGGVGSPSGLNPDPNPIHRWGGSLYLYLPEANALRLSTGVRPSMVCFSALRPRATVSQMVVLGFGLISSPILCRWPSRSD